MIDSRASGGGTTIRRRRECLGCEHRYTTYEEIEQPHLMVLKRDGRFEELSRDKLIADLGGNFDREVPYGAVGTRVMEGLRELDPVAYVRYASIYRRFEEATDFVQEVKKLEKPYDTLTARLPGI